MGVRVVGVLGQVQAQVLLGALRAPLPEEDAGALEVRGHFESRWRSTSSYNPAWFA